jgi:hypothetical protein
VYAYTAYGLAIHSFLPLPELICEEQKADVVFRLGKIDESNLHTVDKTHRFKADSNEAYYFMEGVGSFLARKGQEIIVDPRMDADERVVRLCLLGPVLALILHQRQRLVLHASAIAAGDKAIVFLGGQGWGKSTLAAALHVRGYRMLADDVTAVQMDSDCPKVLPGFPQFKLWPDAVTALGDSPEGLPLVHPDFAKRAFRATSVFSRCSLPLKRIYVLGRGEYVEIEPLSPREALLELIRHSYAARFGNHLLQATGIAKHFKQCVGLVQNARLYRFRRPTSLSFLDEQVSILINDISREKESSDAAALRG